MQPHAVSQFLAVLREVRHGQRGDYKSSGRQRLSFRWAVAFNEEETAPMFKDGQTSLRSSEGSVFRRVRGIHLLHPRSHDRSQILPETG